MSEYPKTKMGQKAVAEIDDFLQQVLADQRELDADPTPQTPTYALLAAGRLEEAETVARQAVSVLEVIAKSESATLQERNSIAKRNNQLGLLAEALIAYGIALARLKRLEEAQRCLERAIAVAQEAGAADKAGVAALTMIEELEQLPSETLLSAYQLASIGMAKMRNRKLQWRVIDAAKKVMTSFWGEMDSDRALEILLTPAADFDEASYERTLIKKVLPHTEAICIVELRNKVLSKRPTTVRPRSRKD
ncbi:MAG: hypothetical protein ACREA9_16325 [Pyrinomonadaceae bacterium]